MNNKYDWDFDNISFLNEGGSGKVHIIEDKNTKKRYALKCSKNSSKDRTQRFQYEINTCLSLKGKENTYKTVPIIHYDIQYKWYILELGKPILEYIKEKELNPFKIISLYIYFLRGVKKLHKKGIYHRDIKPDNIIFYKRSLRIIDFGIAYDNNLPKHNITLNSRDRYQLGAKFTMAPEMRRNPVEADYCKADIYSLIKTLWILISKEELCFDGSFILSKHSLEKYFNFTNVINLSSLHTLIDNCTSEDPKERLSINQIIKTLDQFLWDNNNENYGLGKKAYLNTLHSSERIKKHLNMNLTFDILESKKNNNNIINICNLFNQNVFNYSKTNCYKFKNIFKLQYNTKKEQLCIFYDEMNCIKYHITDIQKIFYVNKEELPFFIHITIKNKFLVMLCDLEHSNHYLFYKQHQNKFHINNKYLLNHRKLITYLINNK